jgi:diguanylate cyclase (GGDEF)-like protein
MKAKVLVVEDSKEQRKHLASMLEARGYEVRAASGGLEALREIKAEAPDIVILDVQLHDLDGYGVCRWMRLTESTRDIAVIMLTVRGEVKERVEGLHVGADDYIPKPFDEDELEARIYAALRSRSVRRELRQRNAELENMIGRAEQLALTDPVTGIFNRRRFMDVLKREWAAARRYGHPLSCALVDIDHFKNINDGSGHAAGDDALRCVAEVLASSVREVDVCARYGGDEFAVLLPHTPLDKAHIVMERIRGKLAASGGTTVSISVGISSSEDGALKGPDELLEASDRALYEAKREGRDRIVLARRRE